MSVRDKYNKTAQTEPQRKLTAAEELLQNTVVTEIQKEGNTEIKTKKATFVLGAELHTKLKTRAAIEQRNMADIVTEALEMYFED